MINGVRTFKKWDGYRPQPHSLSFPLLLSSPSRDHSLYHGRRPPVGRGQVPAPPPSEFGVGPLGVALMQIALPLRFCHIGTKRSVLRPSRYAKIHTPSRLGRGTSPHAPTDTALTHLRRSPCVPQKFQPDLTLRLLPAKVPWAAVSFPSGVKGKAYSRRTIRCIFELKRAAPDSRGNTGTEQCLTASHQTHYIMKSWYDRARFNVAPNTL